MPLSPEDELIVQRHSLQFKNDPELVAMLTSHENKHARMFVGNTDENRYLSLNRDDQGWVRVTEAEQLRQSLGRDPLVAEVDTAISDQVVFYTEKKRKLEEINRIIPIEQQARKDGVVVRISR